MLKKNIAHALSISGIRSHLNRRYIRKERIKNIRYGEAVCVIDFQMNLGHCYADAVQVEHWAKAQTTMYILH